MIRVSIPKYHKVEEGGESYTVRKEVIVLDKASNVTCFRALNFNFSESDDHICINCWLPVYKKINIGKTGSQQNQWGG